MKLIKLLVTNFRGIGGSITNPGIEIDFENIDLVYLIGQNNTGKSTVLHAYEYFFNSSIKSKFNDFHNNILEPIVIEGWIQAENDEDRQHSAMVNSIDGNGIGKFKKQWDKVDDGYQKYTLNPTNGQWEPGGAGGFDTLLQNACPEPIWLRGLDDVEIILEKVQKLIKEKVIDNAINSSRISTIQYELEELRKEIVQDEYSVKLETRLNEMMQETFPNLRVSLFGDKKDDISKKLSSFIQTDINFSSNNGEPLHMSNHGHGIRRQFLFNSLRGLNHVFKELEKKSKNTRDAQIINNIDQKDQSSRKKMLLIEEPELFLHPQSIRLFSKILHELVSRESDSQEFQIIAATHSPILIDLSKDHTTLIKTNVNSSGEVCLNQVKSSIFDGEEKEHMKMLNTFNPYICEAFFNDKVILVEGDTEAVVFRELLNKFVMANKVSYNDVPLVVNCGTKNNIPSFQKVLNHFKICYTVIHDLDDTLKSNGERNSAWTLNFTIENGINQVRNPNIARRYIMERNFESAHNYIHRSSLGKPLSAYKLVQGWDVNDSNIKAVEALNYCLDYDARLNFDTSWVNARDNSKII